MARLLILLACVVALDGCSPWGGKSAAPDAPSVQELFDAGELHFQLADWETDFSKHTVALTEFEGGPPRDGIPAIDRPKVVSIRRADRDLAEREPVLVVESGREARAYPVQILVWHEIVNDELDGRPIAVTYCPLCNSGVVLDRRVGRRVLDFGTTGTARHSDLVMYDRQTQSWWQQITGEAVVGELAGQRLRRIPVSVLSWGDFKRSHPRGDVLSRETGYDRTYGKSPYSGYEDFDAPLLFYAKRLDHTLPPKERVLAVFEGRAATVIPFSRLRREPVVNARVGTTPFVVAFDRRVASPLDANQIRDSRDVGTATAFDRRVRGRALRFSRAGGSLIDAATRSRWDPATGRATRGPLRGGRLRPVRHDQQFWFALAAFVPNAQILR